MPIHRSLNEAEILSRQYGDLALFATWRDGLKNLSVIHMSLNGNSETRWHRHPYEEVIVVLKGSPIIVFKHTRVTLDIMDCEAILSNEEHKIVNPQATDCHFLIALSPHRNPRDVVYLDDPPPKSN